MRVEYVLDRNGTGAKRYRTAEYLDGAWRIEARIGTAGEATSLWLPAKGQAWTYWHRLGVATVEDLSDAHRVAPLEGSLGALDYAKKITGIGPFGSTDGARVERAGQGRERLVVDGANGSEGRGRVEILFDSNSKRPIEAVAYSSNAATEYSGPVEDRVLYRFRFDDAPTPADFEPKFGPGVRVLNILTERARVKALWQHPLFTASVGGRRLEVRDLRIGDSGDVYLVYTTDEPSDWKTWKTCVPIRLTGPRGETFVRALLDDAPGGNDPTSAAARSLAPRGRQLRTAHWTPLVPTSKAAVQRLTFEFGLARPNWVAGPPPPKGRPYPRMEAAERPEEGSVAVWRAEVADYAERRPLDLLLALSLHWPDAFPELTDYQLRGMYYRDVAKDYRRAIEWFWKANEACRQAFGVRRIAVRIGDIAACLEALGKPDDAAALRRSYGLSAPE